MASSDAVIATVVVATGVNVYGAVQRKDDPIITIIGGFIVGAFLLAIAEAAPKLAELFAAAYAITSFTVNGKTLIDAANAITSTSGSATATPAPDTQHNANGIPFTQVVAN